MKPIDFMEIEGIQVGHAQDLEAATGCTVILSAEGAAVGVDVRGGAPGTRETDLLNPVNLVDKVHAVLLTGGSAFGLDAAAGVMQYLEEHNIGFDTEEVMIKSYADRKSLFSGHTTIGAIVTNAAFTKAQAAKLASMAQNGYARTMRPAHSMYDGDTIFAMSFGSIEADLSTVGLLAARVMERAVIAAVENAPSLYGLKCCADLRAV